MVSLFSLPGALLFLAFYGTPVSSLISGTNNSTIGSPSYPNATSSINDTTAASTTTVSFVNGSAAVQSCYLDWASWILADAEWFVSEVFGDEFVTVTSETITSIVYSTYKLCDGIPRAVLDGDLNYTTVTISQDFVTPPISYTYESILSPSLVVLSTVTITEAVIGPVSVRSLTTTFDEPLPTCIIAPSDCASLYVESSNAMFTGGGINYTASPPLFACATVFDEYLPRTDYSCVVDIPVVQLIYWPVTLASQDLCVYPDPIDITAPPSNTPVASMFGRNFTSDENCYLSYPIAIAYFFGNYTAVAETEPGDIIAIPSSNLRSFRNFEFDFTELFTYSFNFADLPPNHVPVLAYEAGASCSDAASEGLEVIYESQCATIYEALYAPLLAFPTELINRFPQWADCDFGYAGLYDPPTSLVPVEFLTPTSTARPATTAASPGWSGDPITPSSTPVPITQAPPTTTEPVESSATAIGSDLGSGTGSESDEGPAPGTVIVFGYSGGSVASSNGAVVVSGATLLSGQVLEPTASALFQGSGATTGPLLPATAVFTLGDGSVVTATSIAGASGSPIIVVGSQTLTAGQAFTTHGAVLSVVDGGLFLSSEAFDSPGAILTVNSETVTAIESVNGQGSTVIHVGDVGEIVAGGPAITLSGGVVLSAEDGGLVVVSSGGATTVSYSGITIATSTSLKSLTPLKASTSLKTTSSPPATTISVTSTSKKGGSSRAGLEMKVLAIWLFVALGML